MRLCQQCNKPLITTGKFWIHPDGPCQEYDGINIRIESKEAFDLFQNKYGKAEVVGDDAISAERGKDALREALALSLYLDGELSKERKKGVFTLIWDRIKGKERRSSQVSTDTSKPIVPQK